MAADVVGEFSMVLRADRVLTYSDVETALLDAGFSDYVVERGVVEGSTTVAITVRAGDGSLDAQLTSLADVAARIGDSAAGA